MIGTFLDAIRSGLIEDKILYEREKKHGKEFYWDFFFWGDQERFSRFYENYFVYYQMDVNFILAAPLVLIISGIYLGICKTLITLLFLLIMIVVFYVDAKSFREDMMKLLQDWRKRNEKEEKSTPS